MPSPLWKAPRPLARSIRDLLFGKQAADPSINVAFEQVTAVCLAALEQALADAKRRLAATSIHALQVLQTMEPDTCVANAVSAFAFCLRHLSLLHLLLLPLCNCYMIFSLCNIFR